MDLGFGTFLGRKLIKLFLILIIKKHILKLKILVFILISQFALSQTTWSKKSFLNNKIEINCPNSLMKMSDEMYKFKYHMSKRPEICLADENAEVSLIGDMRNQVATDKDLEQILKNTIKAITNQRSDIIVIDSGVKTINNKKIANVKFISQAIDQKIFNDMTFLSIQGKAFLISFNCIEKLQKEWEPIADKIVNSIIVKN